MVNTIALFNTRYMDRAIGHVRDGDRPSMITTSNDYHVRQHIELYGRYSFSLPETVRTGELRPLPRPS